MAKKSPSRSQADDATTSEPQPKSRSRSRATTSESAPRAATNQAPDIADSFAARPEPGEQAQDGWQAATSDGTDRTPPTETREAVAESRSMGSEPSEQDVRMRAYHRYLARGGGDGMDHDDWVQAERELRNRK
jgi:hypothetical protein